MAFTGLVVTGRRGRCTGIRVCPARTSRPLTVLSQSVSDETEKDTELPPIEPNEEFEILRRGVMTEKEGEGIVVAMAVAGMCARLVLTRLLPSPFS